MLQLDGVLFFIDGDNLEKITVQSSIPASYFREGYPMVGSTQLHALHKNPAKIRAIGAAKHARATFFINLFYALWYTSDPSVTLLPDFMAQAFAA